MYDITLGDFIKDSNLFTHKIVPSVIFDGGAILQSDIELFMFRYYDRILSNDILTLYEVDKEKSYAVIYKMLELKYLEKWEKLGALIYNMNDTENNNPLSNFSIEENIARVTNNLIDSDGTNIDTQNEFGFEDDDDNETTTGKNVTTDSRKKIDKGTESLMKRKNGYMNIDRYDLYDKYKNFTKTNLCDIMITDIVDTLTLKVY